MTYYTYVLKSELNGSYYIGSSKDIDSRIKLHNSRKVKSTKRYVPWKVFYFEEYSDLTTARQREPVEIVEKT